jgi:hypothetical protein
MFQHFSQNHTKKIKKRFSTNRWMVVLASISAALISGLHSSANAEKSTLKTYRKEIPYNPFQRSPRMTALRLPCVTYNSAEDVSFPHRLLDTTF